MEPCQGQNLSDIGEDYKNVQHDTTRQGKARHGQEASATRTTGRGISGLQIFGRRAALATKQLELFKWCLRMIYDGTKLYLQRYKFDLKYSGINVLDCVLHFLMLNDTKADEKLLSIQDI